VRFNETSRCLLVIAAVFSATITGCISRHAVNGVASAVADAVVTQALMPPLELALSARSFQQGHGRWPTNYAELSSFTRFTHGSALPNYDRVNFSEQPDGSLEIVAFASGVSNRMTLSLTDESKK
jgi:hypothetical protein